MIERIIIGIIFLSIAVAAIFIRRAFIKRKGENLHEKLQSQKESDAGRKLEIEVLKEKMDEAIYALKTSELGVQYRGSGALYALPWFVVIGPAAAGKSTLLRHSGLHFPLSEEDIRIKGYGGTRNCDWWFSDEAIFLDTAGRYTTEDDDREEWKVFLKLLKKNRPRLPLNGILVVLSVSDLLSFGEEDLTKHAKLIRERIAEMTSELGYLFPVYIILTKMDLLPGFSDFFPDAQHDVFGLYLGQKTQDVGSKLTLLYEMLLGSVVRHVQREDNNNHRLAIINFPVQFERVKKALENFTRLLFKDNPYQETPHFIGIYFTSATDKQYFIKDIFTRVIFPHQFLKQKSKESLLNVQWLKTASVIVALGAILGAFLLYSASFTTNTFLLHEGVELTQENVDSEDKLQSLRALADYVNKLTGYKDNIPLHLRLGLYRGNDVLPLLSHYVIQELDHLFLPPVANGLEKMLMHYQERWALNTDAQNQQLRGDYYSALKVYLMLCEPEHMDPELAAPILASVWSQQTGLPENLLRSTVHFYITAVTRLGWGEKADLVQLSRQQLYSQADVNNLYAGLRAKGLGHFGVFSIPEFSSNKSISLFFTKDAYENWVKDEMNKTGDEALKGDWVMGPFQPKASPEQMSQLKNQLEKLYFSDYINQWLLYLQQIHLKPFGDMEDATKSLDRMTDTKGPLSQLLLTAQYNLDIENTPVKEKFKELIVLSPDTLQQYTKQLSGIKNLFQKLMASADVARESQRTALQLLSSNESQSELYAASIAATTAVTTMSDNDVRSALENILLTPVKESWRLILQEATHGLEAAWQAQVVSVYQQTLSAKFPFSLNGVDADRGDIARFFNESNGVMWQFINQNLLPYLQQTPQGFQERTWLGIGVGFSPQFLTTLSKAKIISAGFFTESASDPKFTFEIYPEPTPGLREINLMTNGQTYRYRNDPQEWQKMHWPGQEPNDDTVLSIVTAKDGSEGTIESNSVWGFFKLLKQANLSKDKDNAMEAAWTMTAENGQHYRVSFLIRSNQSNNVVSALMMDRFDLPHQLFLHSY